MEKIKLNNVIKNSSIEIDKVFFEENSSMHLIYFKKEYLIQEGDTITLERRASDQALNREEIFTKKVVVEYVSPDRKMIKVRIPLRERFFLKNIVFPEKDGQPFELIFDRDVHLFQNDIWKIDGKDGSTLEPSEKFFYETEINGIPAKVTGIFQYNDYIMSLKNDGVCLYDKAFNPDSFFCQEFDTDIVVGSEFRSYENMFYYITGKTEKDGIFECAPYDETVRIQSINRFMTIQVSLDNKTDSNLNQEDYIDTYYKNAIKDSISPEIIDMEKICFEPYYTSEGKGVLKYIPVSTLKIIPHFRDRSLDGWNTNDDKYWNADVTGEFDLEPEEISLLNKTGDAYSKLNFNEDDVRYQKNRLKQSFIRLSFYDSQNPFDQQLLYYSTVFLDSGRLFGEYIRKYNEENGKYSEVSLFTGKKQEICDELRCDFKITDRYDMYQSSEGFYLYLFPSLLEELADKNNCAPIYMKVEFNHAGVGKTVPLAWYKGGVPKKSYNKMVKANENSSGLIYDGCDMESYYSDLFIKLYIEFVPAINKYIYRFADQEAYSEDGRNVELSLFEPKLNDEWTL